MTNKLKPCPFCGGEARLNEPVGLMSWCVDCPNPSCQAVGRMSGDKLKAVGTWNYRAIPPGYSLVPDEPTEAMLSNADSELFNAGSMADAYKAMIAAAKEGD